MYRCVLVGSAAAATPTTNRCTWSTCSRAHLWLSPCPWISPLSERVMVCGVVYLHLIQSCWISIPQLQMLLLWSENQAEPWTCTTQAHRTGTLTALCTWMQHRLLSLELQSDRVGWCGIHWLSLRSSHTEPADSSGEAGGPLHAVFSGSSRMGSAACKQFSNWVPDSP